MTTSPEIMMKMLMFDLKGFEGITALPEWKDSPEFQAVMRRFEALHRAYGEILAEAAEMSDVIADQNALGEMLREANEVEQATLRLANARLASQVRALREIQIQDMERMESMRMEIEHLESEVQGYAEDAAGAGL
jgi:hypothetical protein